MIEVAVPDYPQPCYALLCIGIGILRLALRPFPLCKLRSGFPSACNQMLGVDDVASRFIRARRARVQEILETLTAPGQIREVNDRYVI